MSEATPERICPRFQEDSSNERRRWYPTIMRSESEMRPGTIVPNCPAFALGNQDTAFLRREGLSILVASRGPDHIPFVTRALGCRLSPDVRQVTLFFSSADCGELLDHVAANGKIAAVFSLPSTHEALQLKGVDARAETTVKDDLASVSSYRQAFADEIEKLGYPRHLTEAMLACEGIAAVTFTPSAAFSQTPGPRAGQAIGSAT